MDTRDKILQDCVPTCSECHNPIGMDDGYYITYTHQKCYRRSRAECSQKLTEVSYDDAAKMFDMAIDLLSHLRKKLVK